MCAGLLLPQSYAIGLPGDQELARQQVGRLARFGVALAHRGRLLEEGSFDAVPPRTSRSHCPARTAGPSYGVVAVAMFEYADEPAELVPFTR